MPVARCPHLGGRQHLAVEPGFASAAFGRALALRVLGTGHRRANAREEGRGAGGVDGALEARLGCATSQMIFSIDNTGVKV